MTFSNADFFDLRRSPLFDFIVNFRVDLAGVSDQSELSLGKFLHQPFDFFDLVGLRDAHGTLNGVDEGSQTFDGRRRSRKNFR